jgi:hypothetical protein
MKKLVLALFLFFFSFENSIACTVVIEPLRKTLRHSKNVFVGEIISVDSPNEAELPKKRKEFMYLSKLTFKVDKSWKGNNKQVIVYSSPFCDCPMKQYNFSVGEKFLVFADRNSNYDICNLSNIQLSFDKNKNSQDIIKQLDKFWFRAWARIYPF